MIKGCRGRLSFCRRAPMSSPSSDEPDATAVWAMVTAVMCRVCTVEALERELSLILCFPPGASAVIGFFSLFFPFFSICGVCVVG